MSDNSTPERCPSCGARDTHFYIAADGTPMQACGRCVIQWRAGLRLPPEPPAPRISEEEIQRVAEELCKVLAFPPHDYWYEKFAAILRTLNEEKKA